jgi:uncharacterized protein
MKWSKYNYLYWSEKINKWILFNSVSGALVTLDRENYEELINLKNNPEMVHQYSNSDELIDAQILVHKDITAINKMKLQVLQNRLSKNILDLTIAPSLSCNFKCSYCFQQELPAYVMNEETENNLVRFVNLMKQGAQYLRITWFGGEPLLALDRIKSFCQKIKGEINVPLESHMITNGYLLDDATINTLRDLGVTFYQITIDGLEATHNRRRPLRGRKGTFKTIINNIETLLRLNNKTKIAIRVNVDSETEDEYHAVYQYLYNKFGEENIRVHAGFIDNYSFSCRSLESCSLKRHERAKFFVDQYARYGIYSDRFYPTINHNSCMARYINSYVVGPHGELYKCLSLLGVKEMSIGNVNNEGDVIENEDLLVEFLKGNDYLDNPECNQCLLFPVCDGGCPYLKLKEELFGEVHDTCQIAKGNLHEFLEMHIDMKEKVAAKVEAEV